MKKPLVTLFVVVGVIFIALAVYYWVTPAGSLLHFLPGYQGGSVHKHLKHGLAALILGLGCGVIAWFVSGKKTTAA
jgi:hypothetical protein